MEKGGGGDSPNQSKNKPISSKNQYIVATYVQCVYEVHDAYWSQSMPGMAI
jgi:hypothetical protein